MQAETAGQGNRGIMILTGGSGSALCSRDLPVPSQASQGHGMISPQAGIVEPSSACSTKLGKHRETKLIGMEAGAADPTGSSEHRNKSCVLL